MEFASLESLKETSSAKSKFCLVLKMPRIRKSRLLLQRIEVMQMYGGAAVLAVKEGQREELKKHPKNNLNKQLIALLLF